MNKLAHGFLKFASYVWVALVLVLVVAVVANVVVIKTNELSKILLLTIFSWFLLFGSRQVAILIIFASLFIVLPFIAWIVIIMEKTSEDGDVLRQYLRSVCNDCKELGLAGIYPRGLSLVTVTLNDNTFMHLRAVPDRPRYDNPEEQQRQFEEVQNRTDLGVEERERQKQRLHHPWDMLEEQTLVDPQSRAVNIEAILQGCTATNPVAVILGAPGSGKSTCLRWLALHKSGSLPSKKHRLPDRFGVRQIPILLHIGDYAKYITSVKEEGSTLSFKDFFKAHS